MSQLSALDIFTLSRMNLAIFKKKKKLQSSHITAWHPHLFARRLLFYSKKQFSKVFFHAWIIHFKNDIKPPKSKVFFFFFTFALTDTDFVPNLFQSWTWPWQSRHPSHFCTLSRDLRTQERTKFISTKHQQKDEHVFICPSNSFLISILPAGSHDCGPLANIHDLRLLISSLMQTRGRFQIITRQSRCVCIGHF